MKKTLLAITGALLVLLAGSFCTWRWYDANVDRSGWVEEEGSYRYQDFHGKNVTGWQTLEGNTYYFDDRALMATDWQSLEGNTYFFGTNGVMRTGWQELDGKRYYFGADGVMVTGWQEFDGNRYYFQENGSCQTGWLEEKGERYYFNPDGVMVTGWATIEDHVYYLTDTGTPCTGEAEMPLPGETESSQLLFSPEGILQTGWVDREDGRRYYNEKGARQYGWLELEDKRYYLGQEGVAHTGWLEMGEYTYYFREDGSAVTGKQELDGKIHYFTPKGIEVLLVNANNPIPEDYTLDLVTVSRWYQLQRVCADAFLQMLQDCENAGYQYWINNTFRSLSQQKDILKERTEEFMKKYHLDYAAANKKALMEVAVPGTSEHQLGLAADIAGDIAHAWLGEHCWEYGFILRYPEGKSEITGIDSEPWHFRYVGVEVSMDMRDTGLCLEEYLGADPVVK